MRYGTIISSFLHTYTRKGRERHALVCKSTHKKEGTNKHREGDPESGVTDPFFFKQIMQVRNWIMPINRKYKLSFLLETLREELKFKHNYKVLFEYVMLAGINDRLDNLSILNNDSYG